MGSSVASAAYRRLSAAAGLAGVALLVASFWINPGPPADATGAELVAFARANSTSVLVGAWLQAVAPMLILIFAYSLVRLARATDAVDGWMTFLGGSVLMTVSLVEVALYMTALTPDLALGAVETIGLICLDLIHGVQHLYFIVAAPALFIPLGVVVSGSDALPRAFGPIAVVLGAFFAVLGLATLFVAVLPVPVLALAGVQTLWWVGAGLAVLVR